MKTLNFWTCPACKATNGEPERHEVASGKVECRACGKVLKLEHSGKTTEATRWRCDR